MPLGSSEVGCMAAGRADFGHRSDSGILPVPVCGSVDTASGKAYLLVPLGELGELSTVMGV